MGFFNFNDANNDKEKQRNEDMKKQGYELCCVCGEPINFFKPYMINKKGDYYCEKEIKDLYSVFEEDENMLNEALAQFAIMDGDKIGERNKGENARLDAEQPAFTPNMIEPDLDMKVDSNRTEENNQHGNNDRMKPLELKKKLDEYVVGQEKAKKILCTAVYNHYKRLDNPDAGIEKSNILLVGPTGSGKTFLIQTLAKILDVPLAIADATSLTEAGYVGDDVETVLTKLYNAADNDELKAERGIVYIDEIDKLGKRDDNTKKVVGGKGVQQALLKLLEGKVVEIDMGKREPGLSLTKNTTRLDTKNILFICGGAFPEAEEVIKKRVTGKSSMGFGSNIIKESDLDESKLFLNIKPDDLRDVGMIPEFIGRLPIIAPLEGLTVETLRKILTEPKNAIIRQYKTLMEMDGIRLEFTGDALDAIAEKALERRTGARSLRAILEDVLGDIMFYMPSERNAEVVITREVVEGTQDVIVRRKYCFG